MSTFTEHLLCVKHIAKLSKFLIWSFQQPPLTRPRILSEARKLLSSRAWIQTRVTSCPVSRTVASPGNPSSPKQTGWWVTLIQTWTGLKSQVSLVSFSLKFHPKVDMLFAQFHGESSVSKDPLWYQLFTWVPFFLGFVSFYRMISLKVDLGRVRTKLIILKGNSSISIYQTRIY